MLWYRSSERDLFTSASCHLKSSRKDKMTRLPVNVSSKTALTMSLGSMLGIPVLNLLNGLAVMLYWNWFIRHIWTNAPVLSYPVAVGGLILLSLLLGRQINPLKLPTLDELMMSRKHQHAFRI